MLPSEVQGDYRYIQKVSKQTCLSEITALGFWVLVFSFSVYIYETRIFDEVSIEF